MVFNPNLESGPTPESPVYQQSSGGMAGVAAGAIDILGGFLEQAGERREKAQATQLRQSFISGLEGVRARVDAGDINGASIAAGRAVSSYVAAGGVLDSETRAAATAISGLPENMFGVSQQALDAQAEQTRRANLLQDDQFNAYLFLENQANPNMGEAELFDAAETRFNRSQANAALLADAASTGQLNYEAEGREAISGLIDDFTQGSLGVMINAIDNGQPIDPRAVDSARIEFSGLRREIERSLVNVSDSQRGEVNRQFEQVTAIIDNIGNVLSTEGQTERLNSFVMQLMSAGDLGDYTPQQILSATLASNDLTMFLTAGAGTQIYWASNPQAVQDLMQSVELSLTETARREAAAALPTQTDGTINRNGVISYDNIPETVRNQISEIDESNLVSSMRVDGLLLGDVNATNITSPDMASRLVNRTYEMGAYMLSTEGRPLTPALVQQLGLGPNLADNLNVLESIGLDDEGEALARITLRSGLSTQISTQSNYLSTVEQRNAESGLRWNAQTGEYEITNRAFIEGFAQSVGMSADMMMEGGVVRLRPDSLRDEGWRRQLRGRVGGLDEAFAYRESLGLLQGAFDSLRAEVPEDQGMMAPTASDFVFTSQTRAQLPPTEGALNISMDFNASPSGNARGTEVIIPDNASPEVRAAAEEFNRLVADFAARNGIEGYPVRGVRTRSENGRGIRNTVHAEPFFNTDTAMQEAIRENPAEFAAIYAQAFGSLSGARVLAAHGEGNDRGATSEIFGDETSFGELMAQSFTGDVGDVGATAPRGRAVGQTPRPAGGGMGLQGPIEDMLPPSAPAPQAQTEAMGLDVGMTASAMEEEGTPAVDMSAGDTQPIESQEAPARPAQPTADAPPPAQIARNLEEIAQGSQQSFGQNVRVANLALELANRIQAGDTVGYEEVYGLLTEALTLPATPEKRRLVNDLYDLAEQMRGQ
jgi:hypothetical protein